MNIHRFPDRSLWQALTERAPITKEALDSVVPPIVETVRREGDEALKRYTLAFDQVLVENLRVQGEEFEEAAALVPQQVKEAIEVAIGTISSFHSSEAFSSDKVETAPGVTCWRRYIPLEKVGLYVPGGSAPLFSSLLMSLIPAQVAGCEEIVLCSPPGRDGRIAPVILYIAKRFGLKNVFKVGGAQAIAAMAFGTESIPKVQKICGPGNSYVTAAKQIVSGQYGVAIDLPAGPSEVLVIADENAPTDYVAADLLAQAEHGPDSQVILVTTNEEVVTAVVAEVEEQLKLLPRAEVARKALKNSRVLLLPTLSEAMAFSNLYAPEHLILAVEEPEALCEMVKNAGSVFLGYNSPESLGDYASGTNHILPTYGLAAAWSGVSVSTFMKRVTFQKVTKEGIYSIGPATETMAEAEGLWGHKNAVTVRMQRRG